MIRDNQALMAEVDRICEVAGYLWEKGWAERNGGNISVNVTELLTEAEKKLPALAPAIQLQKVVSELGGNVFFVTGTGKRMRYVAREPFANGSLIRINSKGDAYEIIAEQPVAPTSELPSHLAMHDFLISKGRKNRVVLHTHPTNLVALSHSKKWLNSEYISRTLWAMIPESRIIVPKGIGIVPYELPGSMELAYATIKQLENHDMVLWEKHGLLMVGEDIIECFDAIDTMAKSADIYLDARTAGFEPEGMTDEQLDELVDAFNLPNS